MRERGKESISGKAWEKGWRYLVIESEGGCEVETGETKALTD